MTTSFVLRIFFWYNGNQGVISMKNTPSMKDVFPLSFGEEIGNSISHGALGILYLFLTPFISIYSYNKGGYLRGIGVGIYMICIFLMLIVSCLYHSMEHQTSHKYVFRKLDHIMILLAIAGSYTPIALCLFNGFSRILVLAIEWIAVLGGILLKSISNKSYPLISAIIYLSMGWAAVLFLPKLIVNGTPLFLGLIVSGGLLYTIGMIFYSQKKKFFHFVWHIFIDLACVLHFIAIVFFM